MSALHRYAGFGLTFECELPSPGFAPSDEPADVRIRIGAVPARLERPVVRGLTFEADAHRVLLRCPGSARFLIQEATDITMQPESEAPDITFSRAIAIALCPSFAAIKIPGVHHCRRLLWRRDGHQL